MLGFIPNEDKISVINSTGGNLLDLPQDNPLYKTAKEIFAKII
jgi:hypothetical protein